MESEKGKVKSSKPKILLGQLLLEDKLITQGDLDTALEEQSRTHELLGHILMKQNRIQSSERFYSLLAEHLDVLHVSLKDLDIPKDTISRIPAPLACFYKVVPVEANNGELIVATSDPGNIHNLDALNSAVPGKIKPVLSADKDIVEAIRRYYGVGAETIERMMGLVVPPQEPARQAENIDQIESEASIGRFVNQLLWEAYKDRATDIHIEPFEDELGIRYRIDGILHDARVPANIKHFRDSIISRFKILSNLNIAEKRLPQDGRFNVHAQGIQLDMRVSFLPTAYGESVVIRILHQNQLLDIGELGLAEQDIQLLDRLIARPHGIIFVTGPTGSGKTTTLYSCLSRIKTAETKILTIEDPIEYQLHGITQIQVNPAIGLTFAQGLRSMLRHDPDIMMVGEVRDPETAEIAIQVALTGHLVFSTLHTNDASGGITRLLDMGLEPYLLSSSVICFIAQRLVRVLCPKCKQEMKASGDAAKEFGIEAQATKDARIFGPHGCEFCQGTGYHGRKGIYEFLVLDEEIQDMIQRRASAHQIRAKALSKGMRTLREDGWEKIKKGLTSPEEVIRVTALASSEFLSR